MYPSVGRGAHREGDCANVEQEVYGKSLYLRLNFAVNFKLLLKRHGSLNVLKEGKKEGKEIQ